jgi:hypothetical protein
MDLGQEQAIEERSVAMSIAPTSWYEKAVLSWVYTICERKS